LNAAFLLAVMSGLGTATAGYAATCAALPELGVKKVQGEVYGPSGVAVPQIVVRVSRDGKFIGEAKTDGKGKFVLNTTGPALYDVAFLFLGSKSMGLKVRVGRRYGGVFSSPRLRVVLGLSGTRCGFATTDKKEFKKALLRYSGQLEEKLH
jgi:hypothetical protein